MKISFSIFLILLFYTGIAQTDFTKEIEKNIFRATATVPSLAVAMSYERQIVKPLTVVFNLGPAFNAKSASFTGNNKTAWNIYAQGSVEARCYYNLKHRLKKEKTIRNYSANYLSIEQFFITNPIISINQPRVAAGGSSGLSLNVGLQRQTSKHFYIGGFLGVKIVGGNVEGAYSSKSDPLRFGITLGHVF
jgi:hypothetical protein